jgi:type VI secretion system protein ImpM
MNDVLPPEPSPTPSPSSSGGIDTAIAGWYGKLPSLGDFAARRLSDGFVAPWDAWLSERIAKTQIGLGTRWLSLYLTCPVWRFFAMPGAIAPGLHQCWTGVLMASVDRVGRHFPLTIAAALPCAPATASEIDGVWKWLCAIETVALAALDFDHTIERLDAQLALLPVPAMTRAAPRGAVLNEPLAVPSAAQLPERLARAFAPIWQTEVLGMSLWTAAQCSDGSTSGTGTDADTETSQPFTLWPVYGLPDDDLFTTMLLNHGP